MAKNYTLDTSAIFALTKNEKGSPLVDKILHDSEDGACQVYISYISLLELYYITTRQKNEKEAKRLILLIKAWPVEFVNLTERVVLIAGRIKSSYKVSIADSIIIATAIEKKSILIHKDPEIESVKKEVKTLRL